MKDELGIVSSLEIRARNQRKWAAVLAGLITQENCPEKPISTAQMCDWLATTGRRVCHVGELMDAQEEGEAAILAYLDAATDTE